MLCFYRVCPSTHPTRGVGLQALTVLLHKYMAVTHLLLEERAEHLRGLFRLLLEPLPASVGGGGAHAPQARLIRCKACVTLLAATRALRLTTGAGCKRAWPEDGELYPELSAIGVLDQVRCSQCCARHPIF